MAKNKPEHGNIYIDVRKSDGEIRLKIWDDGAGLDLQKLRAKSSMSKASIFQLSDLIFEDGVSTKGVVSQVSGRGVGMAAVREILEDLGGGIHIVFDDEVYMDRKLFIFN